MRIRAVLFDLDGTLVDSNDGHVTAWEEAFARVGRTISREAIHGEIGKGGDMLLPSLLPDADEPTRKLAEQAHSEVFRTRYLPRVRPFAGARDLLARVHDSGRKVVLASSASQAELEHYTDVLDAAGLVDASTSGDEVQHTKPCPDIFERALDKVHPIGAAEAVVVGDSPYDMQAAQAAGIVAVGLRSGGFEDHVLQEAGASAIYDDVQALLEQWESCPLAA